MRSIDYPVTEIDGKGKEGDIKVCFTVIRREDSDNLQKEVLKSGPQIFVTVEDLADIHWGVRKDMYSKTPAWLRLRKF
ncbi:MAG: DUF2179 domain-containing protein [Candidatus Eremiobacteraeota bacterium]|nr:DUF2179 domain-containing protein [Candidatus Eremiobacteraeota bacterium]